MNLIHIYTEFPTQESCARHLESMRWPEGPVCPYCQSGRHSKLRERYHCNACNKSYSVTVGTMFHNTRVPLQKWFLALTLVTNAKKGTSARQLARDLGVTKNTAWGMQMRIRKSMQDEALLSGVVEMDETYIGGKGSKNKLSRRGRGTSKEAVVGMVERGGRVKAYVQEKYLLRGEGLANLVKRNVDLDNSMVITDEYTGYSKFSKIVRHKTINHSERYVDCLVHTNTIESFWATLKRSISGQHHSVTAKHLQKYVNEACFRYNNRHNPDIWQTLLERALA